MAAQQLQDVLQALKTSTSKTYQNHWDSFVQFVKQFLNSPFQLTIDIQVLIMFLSYLFEQSKGYSTILVYLCGVTVSYHMKLRVAANICASVLVKKNVCRG